MVAWAVVHVVRRVDTIVLQTSVAGTIKPATSTAIDVSCQTPATPTSLAQAVMAFNAGIIAAHQGSDDKCLARELSSGREGRPVVHFPCREGVHCSLFTNPSCSHTPPRVGHCVCPQPLDTTCRTDPCTRTW
ncbi:hypothetical protein C0Q70_02289 [Pomacea canaliculata]|uniref:Uncharacterized protein n=1 Tax=Pomacea canaliculata TaxID=400727 RepID=A0A2T7PPH3_POMCA|nr:hypothetical protein C0Q70_02289 [Pomacea canaliculata]